ncbi:hypothetical protein F4808DRAFT_457242 [Astrocystis sublimbata]|nr:hypothetical protein F4808DRAFT_457242 [Astrocystis sublimbata]
MVETSEYKEPKAGWKNEVEVKTYALKDVNKHNSKGDLWIVIHGHVYDISDYARDHPGGVEPLTEVGGQDATSAYEDVGHSEDARDIMQSYLVGVLEGASAINSGEEASKTEANIVKIVRRTVASTTPSNAPNTMLSTAQYSLIALGLSGTLWAAAKSHVLYASSEDSHRSQSGGLVQVALASLSICGVAGAFGLHYFQKASSFGPEYSSFPSSVRSSSARIRDFHPRGILNPSQYNKYRLSKKTELSPGIFKFVFDLPSRYDVLGLPIGQHVAIRAPVDEQTIVRSYTPVSNNRDLGRLELLIRVYPDGQMGNYLRSLNIGQTVDIRGPKGAMRYCKGMCNAIGMVGGGTGITPLFQVIRAICEDDTDSTQVTLIYGNRSESDILLRNRLDHYSKVAGHKFKVHYTLDQPPSGWKGEIGHVNQRLLKDLLPSPEKGNRVFLCGPPGMVNATKRNLVELGFENSGSVSKIHDQIFCF